MTNYTLTKGTHQVEAEVPGNPRDPVVVRTTAELTVVISRVELEKMRGRLTRGGWVVEKRNTDLHSVINGLPRG